MGISKLSLNQNPETPIQKIEFLSTDLVEVWMKREDLIHLQISGNKFRKLKYNLIEAKNQKKSKILTFGGAFSNHIVAVAAAGKLFHFDTIGIIRGEELVDKIETNPTLKFVNENGMDLKFISRESYKTKNENHLIKQLKSEFGDFYLIPEGGTNKLAVKGCAEILSKNTINFDVICCSIGTGGTISGIIEASESHQKIYGFPALKQSEWIPRTISKFTKRLNYDLICAYHFGGFAKVNHDLITFVNLFKQKTGIQIEPIYTGKMLFGIQNMIQNGYFKSKTKLLVIHSGGLQGIKGMNQKLKHKNLNTIQ